MPTIIDSLVVKLGFDASGVKPGADTADAALKRTQKGAKDTAEGFSQIRSQVLSLFALFTGGRGLKEFTSYLATTNAATGRLALTTGMATEKISAWQGMFRSVGGSASSASASLGAFSQALENIGVMPKSANALLPAFNRWGINPFGKDGKPLTADEAYDKFNEAISREHTDPREAASVLSTLPGIDPSAIILMLKSRKDFLETQAKALAWGTTKEQAAAGARIVEQTGWLTTAFEHLGTIILTKVEPQITKMNKGLYGIAEWFLHRPKALQDTFYGMAAGAAALGVAIGGWWVGFPLLIAGAGAALATFYQDWKTWNATGISDFANLWKLVKGVKDWISGDAPPNAARKAEIERRDKLNAAAKKLQDAETEELKIIAQQYAAGATRRLMGLPYTDEERKRDKAETDAAFRKVQEAGAALRAERTVQSITSNPSGSNPNPNNIGNVRPVGQSTGFQQPADFNSGVQLAVNNARSYPNAFNGGKDMTLNQIASHWAPSGDGANVPSNWAKNVAAISGLDPNKPLDLNDPQIAAAFARGVHGAEWGAKAVRSASDYAAALAGRPKVVTAGFGVPGSIASPPTGASAAAIANRASSTDNSRSSTVSVNVDSINLVTPEGADANSHAKQLVESLNRQAQAWLPNNGPI